ncbi:hypothetical protein OAA09_00015 [bacterium]|nr:hypothetical protein [bacterium]
MNYSKTKNTKRFSFGIERNNTAHKAGGNVVTISTQPGEGYYATPTTALSMTVKEAKALQRFLNDSLDMPEQQGSDSSVSV